ncbi:tumor suppressor candidate 2-like [Apostichopus japonicus]|uniref:tumor suppressor candidate 2-like n=1 Tax=Stichopus japonicus TaxID=307972 RepID=UPI003AB338F2
MGGKASTYAWKAVSPMTNYFYGSEGSSSATTVENYPKGRYKFSPLVLKRTGSMYFDEDGHLAHEFYIEVPPASKSRKAGMRRIRRNLTPQGEVEYDIPRLHVDLPMIMCQV